ncbi:anthranilate synthase component II [Liquorilactobacillus satsumensis]|nr:aminodeoxychorismate/anthranilate synthase component II [Liquorilactobacillus satsumensis]MCC7666300.1 type 1 glutamine amidotransferase [Liquorilactobacillus satsumensis]MCP9312773.1 aminodeoxychorismate/anthranilate synthase component II [Liquorilactobacillus satsumensis]MCP9327961.1 aminodeoxychorismate/anthranilate synthase component II [Liquorilactobacillus satsumensis]MCP9358405.1 aminodeoxychorismate/anthranilate synthase component II [Liquorilactobacillus satsumensis]MCP9359213.1 am
MHYLIDNYDSFTYNLYQMVGTLTNETVKVIKNDELTVAQLKERKPQSLIFSPGPGRPQDAGQMENYLRAFIGHIPILGICLGHQAIGEVYGTKVVHAKQLMHGKSSSIHLTHPDNLFAGCPESFTGARYHSLVLERNSLASALKITAESQDGSIMAIADDVKQVYGLQFHPESIMTEHAVGQQIMRNFLQLAEAVYA